MSTFKDPAEVYAYLGKMFEIAVNDPQFVEATKNGDLVVRLTHTDPVSTILIDFPGQKVTCGDAAEGASSTVELKMTADNSHKFWLGKLNLTLAMAQGKAKMTGSRTKALKLLPLTKPLFAKYEELLRDAGRDDLLKV
jgi:putative sterol carrier protein